jgi:hypothetical protein
MNEQSRWMTQLLEASLQSSGLSGRDIEERLGWKPGAVGQMLDGTAECGPQELLAVLAELGSEGPGNPVSPQRRERGTQMVRELIDRFNALGYGKPGAPSISAPPLAAGEIEKTVEDVLQRTFGNLGKGKRGGE